MKKLFENLMKNLCHDETMSASRITPSSDTSCHLLPPTGRRQFSLAFTLAEVFSPCRKTKLSFGFTLAEVLITLGVIGIVAALVIPGVVNGFRRKQLETAFKKAYSIITTAMQATMFEHGLTKYYDFDRYCKGNYCSETSQTDFDDLNVTFKEQFRSNIIKEVGFNDYKGDRVLLYTFNGTKVGGGNAYAGAFIDTNRNRNRKGFLLKDGMLISEIQYDANNASPIGATWHKCTIIPFIFFDTNGPYKGPNRLGYDVFYHNKMTFHLTNCSPLSGSNWGCYLRAIKDENPYDKSISYWEGLYKPKSWWQKVYDNSKK